MARTTSKAPSQRQLRVGEEIRHAVAHVLARGHLRDPALHDISVTVTEARPSPDLKNVTLFVLPLGGVDAESVVAALNRAAGYLRGEVGRDVRLKFTPSLSFEIDRSFDTASNVDALLREDRVARDLTPTNRQREDEPGSDPGA